MCRGQHLLGVLLPFSFFSHLFFACIIGHFLFIRVQKGKKFFLLSAHIGLLLLVRARRFGQYLHLRNRDLCLYFIPGASQRIKNYLTFSLLLLFIVYRKYSLAFATEFLGGDFSPKIVFFTPTHRWS